MAANISPPAFNEDTQSIITLSYTDLPVEPGVIYEVVVTVRVADDADPANDRWSFVFLRNEES